MSGSNWSRYAAIGLTIFGVIVVLSILTAYAFHLGSLDGSKRSQQFRYQAEYAERTDQRIAACFNDASDSPRECVEEAVTDNHEQQRNEADLRAQREMADWAIWMLVISTASLGVTSLGTAFLARQIGLTREAVEDTSKATKAMERQNELAAESGRPWLELVVKPDVEFTPNMDYGSVQAHTTARNLGASPALSVEREIVVIETEQSFYIEKEVKRLAAMVRDKVFMGEVVHPDGLPHEIGENTVNVLRPLKGLEEPNFHRGRHAHTKINTLGVALFYRCLGVPKVYFVIRFYQLCLGDRPTMQTILRITPIGGEHHGEHSTRSEDIDSSKRISLI